MTNTIHDLTALGQSLWYDNIQRRLLENGDLARLIANGDIRGVTSNPTIFHNAIAKTHDYDSALTPLAIAGWTAEQIFWQLAIEDIQAACDLFLPLYEDANGKDGFVSIEVSPYLANDTEGTIAQAKHLWQTLNRPNLMVKIPATKAGIPAIHAAIAAGINVNVTLIFSLERYGEVMEAYLSGLEERHKEGGEIGRIASVASFFVSRVDAKIDPRLPEGSALRGKAAIANARLAYDQFSDVFSTKRFEKLRLSLARAQRPLWASTGTKNPAYPDTLYIVSSKSGGTSEVNANFNYCWSLAEKAVGEKAGEHFIAITDPGTALETLARSHGFRKIFNADPMVGGRYSALTHFGLVPAALMGIDIDKFLARAAGMAADCGENIPAARNPGLVLGAVMGQAALEGRDKLTIIADPALASVGSWLEQLIAESTGKLGKGVVPVDLEPLGPLSVYGHDRWFVYLRKDGQFDAALAELGQPVMMFDLSDPYSLGAEIYRWEVATAVACAVLNVNPFDQPDVQDAKNRTKAKIAEYRDKGKLNMGFPVLLENAQATLKEFIAKAKHGDYIAINAYLPRNPAIAESLTALRVAIRQHTHCATTVGFGPRFLHSTGQLHKGGADNGLFIQITADPAADAEIPTENMTFGTLERAQSLGDFEALVARERRALRIHLPNPEAVQQLVDALE